MSYLIALLIGVNGSAANSAWQKQTIATDADFRGLCVVSPNVAWVSGTQAGTLDSIRQDKAIRLAYREDAPPFSCKNNIGIHGGPLPGRREAVIGVGFPF